MAGDMAKRYRRWFEYEKDSHAKVLEALESAGASQIAMLLRSAGVEPPATDFVFWTRKPIGRARGVHRGAVPRVKRSAKRRRHS